LEVYYLDILCQDKNHLTCSLLQWYDYTSLSLKEEMPMENIKESLSSVVHHWTAIAVAIMFLFSNNNTIALAQAEIVKPKTEVQLKKETLEKYSNTVYKPSEMLTDTELIELLSTVGFEGKALKTAWAIAKRESNGRPLAYNGNRATGDSSYGIFQINMLGNLGVDRKEKFNLKSNESLFDPTKNAEIAYHMTNGGTDWSAWKGLTPRAMEFYLKFPSN
jgi:hypothetical protein